MTNSSKSPVVVLTGGGSGGHITPLLAVAAEIKRQNPEVKLIYIGQKGDNLADIPSQDPNIDESYFVRAGKFRRFHNEGFKQFLDVATFLKNFRDFFYVLIGTYQSRLLLKQLQPKIIFIKGGFIGVPVGLAAASIHLRFITHDSDAIPGLANRIVARWALLHAVALPKDIYNYPADKTITTGIPLNEGFKPVTPELMKSYRSKIGIPDKAKLLFVIGGGLGAQRVNQAVAEAVPHLLDEFSNLYVVQSAGRANEAELKSFYDSQLKAAQRDRVETYGYINDVYNYSGAADLVITRAGATNLAEFALQAKACIVLPNPYLTSGHQLKNANYLAEKQAAIVIDEDELTDDPNRLSKQVSILLRAPEQCETLAANLSGFARPDAREKLASLILEQVERP